MTEEKALVLDFSDPRIGSRISFIFSQIPSDHVFYAGIKFCKEWLDGSNSFEFQTSGSTGGGQTIRFDKGQVLDSVERTRLFFQLERNDTVFVCLNTKYTGGKMLLARALHIGMKAVLVAPQNDPFDLYPLQQPISLLALIPSQMAALLKREDASQILEQTRSVILGGAPVGQELKKELSNIVMSSIYETFGMTETLSHIAVKRLNGKDVLDSFEVLSGVEVASDERECLMVRAKVTKGKWLVTNDLVELLNEQRFIWKGRIDDVVNSGGVKIGLAEVENMLDPLLKQWGFAYDFILGAIHDPRLGSKLVLYVENAVSESDKLLLFLKEKLPKYHHPQHIVLLDYLPRTPSGKLKRINS